MQIPGEALIEKLWETIADKGIGSLLRPWQMRREAEVKIEMKRLELLSLAQAEREAEAIRRGDATLHPSNARQLLVHSPSVPNNYLPVVAPEALALETPRSRVEEIASRNFVADAIDREVNIAKAILKAEEELGADSSTPPTSFASDDWLRRWKEYASCIGSEELQALWGRVLAGEVKTPGNYSVRFLNFLHNLSRDEANLIERAMSFVIDDFIFREGSTYLESVGINFSAILRLQEIGVLAGAEAIGLKKTFSSGDQSSYRTIMQSHGYAIGIRGNDPKAVLEIPAYIVTSLGRQLVSIGKFAPNVEYIQCLGGDIKAKGFSVELGKFFTRPDGRLEIIDAEQL